MVENLVPNRHVMLRIFYVFFFGVGTIMNRWMEWGNLDGGPYLSEILKYVSHPLENKHENAKKIASFKDGSPLQKKALLQGQ